MLSEGIGGARRRCHTIEKKLLRFYIKENEFV